MAEYDHGKNGEDHGNSFEQLGLGSELWRAISELGYQNPTPVQLSTIPFMLERNQDMIVLAQTGTGKTAAYGLPILQQIETSDLNTQVLILSPTRELCIQITTDLQSYAKYLPGIRITAVYGGAPIVNQLRQLSKGSQIIVATPGRMLDIVKRGKVQLQKIKRLVLDEADEMLNMGFQEELNAILEKTPDDKNTFLFSATMPREVASLSKQYMKNAHEITMGQKNSGAEFVTHIYYMVHAKDRYLALKRIVDINPNIYGIVFCRTRQETKEVSDWLMQDGYNADALHGDLSQAQRDHVMDRFRRRSLQMLVATDVAARGLDVDDLTHIINYNLPEEMEIYTHRSGRTGRAGKSGVSIAIINMKEKHKIKWIEKLIGKKFEQYQIPNGRQICEKQLFHLIDRMENVVVDETQIAPYMERVIKKLGWLDKEQLIKHFVSLEFNRFLDYYKDSVDLNVVDNSRENSGRNKNKRDANQGRNSGSRVSRFFINIGQKDKVRPQDIIGIIIDHTQNRSIEIGRIDIMPTFTFFDLENVSDQQILDSFVDSGDYRGRKIRVELADAREKSDTRNWVKGKGKERDRKKPHRKKI